jgi:diguanylate cyclase (GGDEF)-like protein
MTAVMALLLILAVCIVRWYRAQLMRATAIDELTNLSNRRSFITRYQRFAIRPDAGRASIALIDADYFKQINDTYGHAAGDEVLVAIADEVRALAGETGIAGRWGGDEFIAVMDVDPERAAQRVEDMIARIRALDLSCGAKVSTSVGLAEIDYERTLEGNLEAADRALYASKESGRGIFTVYSPDMAPHGTGISSGKAHASVHHARGAVAGFSNAGFDEAVSDARMASSRDAVGASAAKAPATIDTLPAHA